MNIHHTINKILYKDKNCKDRSIDDRHKAIEGDEDITIRQLYTAIDANKKSNKKFRK